MNKGGGFAFEAAVTDIMYKHKDKQKLLIIGSDSMLTWNFKNPIYNGFVIAAAAGNDVVVAVVKFHHLGARSKIKKASSL